MRQTFLEENLCFEDEKRFFKIFHKFKFKIALHVLHII